MIKIAGKTLVESGFQPGDAVEIEYGSNVVTITKSNNPHHANARKTTPVPSPIAGVASGVAA
jgi:hypothetical protein